MMKTAASPSPSYSQRQRHRHDDGAVSSMHTTSRSLPFYHYATADPHARKRDKLLTCHGSRVAVTDPGLSEQSGGGDTIWKTQRDMAHFEDICRPCLSPVVPSIHLMRLAAIWILDPRVLHWVSKLSPSLEGENK